MIVQLWPQADWTTPFVLTPFVVECRAGEGFPVGEISGRIAEATENAAVSARELRSSAEASRTRPREGARSFAPPLIALAGRRGRRASAPHARAGAHARRSCGDRRSTRSPEARTSCGCGPAARRRSLQRGSRFAEPRVRSARCSPPRSRTPRLLQQARGRSRRATSSPNRACRAGSRSVRTGT